MKRALYLGHKKSCVYDRKKKKRKTEIQRVKTHHHACVEGHMLKGKKSNQAEIYMHQNICASWGTESNVHTY